MMLILVMMIAPLSMALFISAIIIAALIISGTWLAIGIFLPGSCVDVGWLFINGDAKREINTHVWAIVIGQRNAWYS